MTRIKSIARIISADAGGFSAKGLPITCEEAYMLVPQKMIPRKELIPDRSQPHPLRESRL